MNLLNIVRAWFFNINWDHSYNQSIFSSIGTSESSKKFSNLKFKIEEGQSQILLDRVNEGDLDMAILALPYDTKDLLALNSGKKISSGSQTIKIKMRVKLKLKLQN